MRGPLGNSIESLVIEWNNTKRVGWWVMAFQELIHTRHTIRLVEAFQALLIYSLWIYVNPFRTNSE